MPSSVDNPYPNSMIPAELSIRNELDNTFDGTSLETPKARICLLRRMRRDAKGNKIACECTDPITHEPDKDRLCPFCLGDGFKWDEVLQEMYKVLLTSKEVMSGPGLINTPQVVFYMKYDTTITYDDKIVEPVLDQEGQMTVPPRRLALYRIQEINPLRLDNGRLEYLKLWAYRQDVKHLNS